MATRNEVNTNRKTELRAGVWQSPSQTSFESMNPDVPEAL